MNKNLERRLFMGVMAIGALALVMLTACKPETGQSLALVTMFANED